MAELTDDEKQQLKNEIINQLKSESQSVDELETVETLDGINTLPAMRGSEVVSAPITLLRKPAEEAAAAANAAADEAEKAATRADVSAGLAFEAAEQATVAKENAETAVANANAAADNANGVAEQYDAMVGTAIKGATARFTEIVEGKEISGISDSKLGSVVWDNTAKVFAYKAIKTSTIVRPLSLNEAVDVTKPEQEVAEEVIAYFKDWDGADMWMNADRSAPLKNKVYIMGESLWVWSDEADNLVEISGSGGGNILNVSELYPLVSGYYTLGTAVAAVESDLRGKGRCLTYETANGKWETKQFVGTDVASWETEASWEDFGGAGTMKSLTVNGEKQIPDNEGNVSLTIEKIEVDESLDESSTNPVQNAAVAAKLAEVEANSIFGADAELSEDESSVRLRLTNKSGAEVVSVDLPAGGGGGGEASTTKIVLGASVDKSIIKEGDSVRLTWTYDHQNSGGEESGTSTGQKAKVSIEVKRGTTTTYSETTNDVSKGTYSLDLTKYLLLGTNDIYVIAETTDPTTGKAQKKQAYISVKSVTLALTSSYNVATRLSDGGYGTYETASIPYAVSGSGVKTVTLYVDGVQKDAHTVTRSGTTNSSFDVEMTGLSEGRHTAQIVAEMEADEGLTLKSESIYIDLLKSGSGDAYVGLMIVNKDGRIFGSESHTTPTIEVGQYESCEFKFAAYDPSTTPAAVEIWRNGVKVQTVSVPRTAQAYQNRFTEQGVQTMKLKVGSTEYEFYIDVTDSGIEIGEATYGLQVKLSPAGRSNGESNPAQWESNGIKTTFEGFDWSSNGWTGESLKLTNGAKATIGYELFKNDAGTNGATIEMAFKVSNVLDRDAEVISCMDNGKGLSVTTQEASIKTGTILHYTNEDGEDASREIKIGTKFASEQWLKVAFVIGKRSEGRLMELYVNGNRAGADIYDNSYYFTQDNPVGITIDSTMADVEVKNIRIYDRALSDDEELDNRMVDASSTDDMMRLYEENDIMGETGDVDIDKLRAQGKGVMRIVRKGGLDEVNETNNKSTDFLADVYFYSPFGKEYDFVLRDCYIRIQGTSSTKYPSKNIRIYFSKGGQNLSFEVNGVVQSSKTYSMRPGATAMNLYCMKSDYSDSSMSLNTGGAKLFNDVMKDLMLLTPPQRYQYEQAGKDLSAVTIRQSIDGFPIDVFSAESVDGESTYYGQYNFNNEKSKSGKLFGMDGVGDYVPECPLTLETLNNTEKTCLFQSESDEELANIFDAGLETNVPDDVKWAGLNEAQRTALQRLYGWIRSCVPEEATADDLNTFKSEKFVNEIDQYFDKDHLLTYYLHTDYFASVDQRAKNILVRTWDGLKWWLTYYDGDTQLGKRNDCFLAYDYTLSRETWDSEASKYAFEGRESWLWNLVLANLQDDLRRCARNYRGKMTVERVLSMLTEEQMGNWSDRAYNKSGYIKYIRPAMVETYGKKWPFIYALQGNNKAFLTYFIKNRFALLDAKYGTDSFTSDNIDLYMSRTSSDAADMVRVTANEVYAFGYGTNNSPNIVNTGTVEGGKTAEIAITGAYTVNDPLRIYGASRMRVLDMTDAADHLKNGFDLGKCTVLRELNMESGATGSTGWWLNLSSCRQLRKVNLRYQAQAKTGGSTSTELDFGNQTKLEELDARGTSVQSVTFAKGTPLVKAQLPGTIRVLKLEYLSKLTTSNITLENYSNVKTLVVDGCTGVDWETLLAKCSNVERLRITGIERDDDGTWLGKFMTMGGVDAEGNATDTCSLVGTIHLTRYMEADEYATVKAHFPELNIEQPDYSMIEFDDSVSDDANVSNLDNKSGYKYGTAYSPSGHIKAILSRRHRVLAKITKKPTTRNVTMAGVETTMNNLDGEMTYYPLDDNNSYKYADGSDAKLDGSEGDWMMHEPGYWYKGINDYLKDKHYSCYSSNAETRKPKTPEAKVMTLADIQADTNGYTKGKKIMSGKDTLASSYSTDSSYSVCRVDVRDYKRVRYPSVPGTSLMGSLFADDSGNIIETMVVPTLSCKFEAGMYLIKDVPEGATALYFTILNTAEFDKVVLSNSDKIEDMEPEWVWSDEHLCAIVGSSVVGSKLRACITGGYTAGNMSWTDFHYYSVMRGMQQIDPLMHSHIANLAYAKYGRRDMQSQCGAGYHSYNRITGGTAKYGMQDTIGFEAAKAINPNVTDSLGDGVIRQYAWYQTTNDNGDPAVVQKNNICCLGYEDIYGHKYDMMDRVDLPNTSGNAGKWRIWMPDGSLRMVKGTTSSDIWITAVAHGLYMDVVPVGSLNGTSSTYYTDKYWVSTSAGRVVYRGNYYAYASGGVSYSNANIDAAYSNASIGSRLAFRGKIRKAESVEAFKAIAEVA